MKKNTSHKPKPDARGRPKHALMDLNFDITGKPLILSPKRTENLLSPQSESTSLLNPNQGLTEAQISKTKTNLHPPKLGTKEIFLSHSKLSPKSTLGHTLDPKRHNDFIKESPRDYATFAENGTNLTVGNEHLRNYYRPPDIYQTYESESVLKVGDPKNETERILCNKNLECKPLSGAPKANFNPKPRANKTYQELEKPELNPYQYFARDNQDLPNDFKFNLYKKDPALIHQFDPETNHKNSKRLKKLFTNRSNTVPGEIFRGDTIEGYQIFNDKNQKSSIMDYYPEVSSNYTQKPMKPNFASHRAPVSPYLMTNLDLGQSDLGVCTQETGEYSIKNSPRKLKPNISSRGSRSSVSVLKGKLQKDFKAEE